MCIAIPAKIIALNGMRAQVQSGLLTTEVLVTCANATIDQWVLVQSGIALERIDETEAQERLAVLQMMQEAKNRT